jgi:WD40 repeat protein
MGRVVRARAGDGREVALKLLGRNVPPEWIARFARERRLLASLGSNEGFVQLLGSGESPEGPYLVMPYLGGGTLRDRLARGPLGIEEGRALGVALARAMARAHAAGIVHRDLKPENILFDGDGRPFVADLGLAKHFDSAAPGASQSVALSRTGELRGTPGYMPAEQMSNAASVGPTADVFALGAIVYECLAGQPAFQGITVLDLVGKVEQGTHVPLGSVRPDVPEGLSRAVERALARDPARRPEDAGAFAAELERAAVPPRRSGLPRLLLAIVLATLLAAAAAVLLPKGAGPGRGEVAAVATEAPVARLFDPGADDSPVFMDRSEIPAGYEAMLGNWRARLLGMCGEYSPHASASVHWIALSPDGRQVLASDIAGKVKLWDVASGRRIRTLDTAGTPHGVAISPDGRRALVVCLEGSVRLYDLDTGKEIRSIGKHRGAATRARFSPDGRLAASCSDDGTIQVFDLEDQTSTTVEAHEGGVFGIVFLPDGKRLLTSGNDETVKLWDVGALRGKVPALIRTFHGHKGWVFGCAVSPDGRLGVSGGLDCTARVWNLETGENTITLEGPQVGVGDAAFTPDGKHVLTGSADHAVRVFDLATKECRILAGHEDNVAGVAVTPDGRFAVSGSWDETVRVWDLATGKVTRTIRERDKGVQALSFLPDGKSFVSGNEDGAARLLDLAGKKQVRVFAGHGGAVLSVATSADGTRAVTGCEDGAVRVYDVAKSAPLFTLSGHTGPVRSVALAANGARAVSGGEDGTVHVWDLQHGREERSLKGAIASIFAVALSPGGDRVVAAGGAGIVYAWNATDGRLIEPVTGHTGAVQTLAIDPDGGHFLSGSDDGTLRLWQLEAQASTAFVAGKGAVVGAVLFPDGKRFASITTHGMLSIWRRDDPVHPTGVSLKSLKAKSLADHPISLAISRDGTALLVGTARGIVFHFRVE